MAFSPDGTTLATGSGDNTVAAVGRGRPQAVATLTGHTDGVFSVAFSPDGKTLARRRKLQGQRARDVVQIWKVPSGNAVGSFDTGVYSSAVAFSPDGKRLATASMGNDAVQLWDVASGKLVATFKGHRTRVLDLAFSPDGTRLATASKDRTARVLQVPRWTRAHRRGVPGPAAAVPLGGGLATAAGAPTPGRPGHRASQRRLRPLMSGTETHLLLAAPGTRVLLVGSGTYAAGSLLPES